MSAALIDFAAASQPVSTLTPLLAFRAFPGLALLLVIANLDATRSLSALFETSQSGLWPDANSSTTATIPPLGEYGLEMSQNLLRNFVRLSAASLASDGFPALRVKWGVFGITP